MRIFKLLHVIPFVAFLCGGSAFAADPQPVTTVIIHDAFTASDKNAGLDYDVNNFRAPTATEAFWLGGGAVPQYTQNSSIKMSAGNRGLLGYFVPSTTLASIEVGETLTATVAFRYTNGSGASTAGDFRMGFLNSGGNGGQTNDGASANPRPDGESPPVARMVNDNFSLTAAGNTPRGYSGYVVDTTAATSPSNNSLSFWRRTGGQGKSQQWLGPTSSDLIANSTFSQIGVTGGGAAGALTNNGTEYVATFAITYVAAPTLNGTGDVVGKGSTKLAYAVTSGGAPVMSYSTTESADAPLTGFDTFMIFNTYNAAFEVLDFKVTRTSIAPAIVTQPGPQVVAAGSDATFTVVATGAPAPTYQWQVKASGGTYTEITGATGTALTLSSVQPADAGTYRVAVHNSAGTATSNPVTLTVLTTPEITTQPSGATISEGQTTTLTAVARGAPTLAYQWKKDGVALSDGASISGATSAALTVTGAHLADAGSYTLVVTNTYGSVTSSPASLVVFEAVPPTIATQPASQSIFEGADVQFTVAVDGPEPFTFQWKKDGVALVDDGRISGATTETLSINSARLTDAGGYTLDVSNFANANAPLSSATATLTVSASPAPLAPVASPARNVAETSFTAQWTRAANATGYRLDLSQDATFATFVSGYEDLDVGTVLSWSFADLAIDTTYYYRVRAYNSAGTSDSSNTVSVTVLTPVAPFITSVTNTTFTAGVSGSFVVTATGAPPPTFTATGLPSWLSLDATTGVLSGTPPAAAAGTTVSIAITAQNDKHPDATQTLRIGIVSPPAVTDPVTISTLAGKAGASGTTDGTGDAARFNFLTGVATDADGNIYVADAANHTIRKVTADGVVTTVAGTAGVSGSADGAGDAATFDSPSGIAVDGSGNLYVADTLNHTIRKISTAGVVSTLAGKAGVSGSADGAAILARFFAPQGLALDLAGDILYVADTNNDTIRRIALASGKVSTLAGAAGQPGHADGLGAVARFDAPSGLAVDTNGAVYVADTENDTIRTVTPGGLVTTLAGRAGSGGAADDYGVLATFNHPSAVAVDTASNVYVLDTDNHTIRKIISGAGLVSTIAGHAGTSGSADGIGGDARFKFPSGLAVVSSGDLYIADTNNHTVRLGMVPHLPVISEHPQSQTGTIGGSVSFSVKAVGTPAPTYQWKHEGVAIDGATSDTLNLSSLTASSAGAYTVDVTNALGTVTSNSASLVVNPVSQPPVGINSGGGGAPSTWFYLVLALFAAVRWSVRRRRAVGVR